MVEFITGPSGSGKTTEMFRRINDGAQSGMEQFILVPEQYSYEFDKTLYNYLGAEKFNELYSLSFTGLARQLFQLYGEPDRKGEYADELARMILIYQAIDTIRSSPEGFRFFSRQSRQNGFAEEIMSLITDMKRSEIPPEALRARAVLMDDRLRDKTLDAAAVYFEYERLMAEYGFKDVLDNIHEAAKTAALNRCFSGRNIYIDEFESFTGDQLELLKVMMSEAANVVITLRTDDVFAGDYTLFETVNNTYRRIADICRELHIASKITACEKSRRFRYNDLDYVSRHIMRSRASDSEEAPKAEHISVFEAKDMYSESEYVCATIKRLICGDSSLKYRDIAVISNSIENYAEVLKAAFVRYDIPCFMSIERSVTHTAIMTFFTSLLNVLTAGNLHSEQLFRLLKSGIPEYTLTDISKLENYCYKWGIDGEQWLSEFRAGDDELELLESMRSSFITPIMELKKKLGKKKKASEVCRLLYGYLADCGAERNTGRLMGELICNNRDFEASELKRLWGCLIDILDSINDTLGEYEMDFSELSTLMRSMIGRINYSVPPQTLDSVIVASARTARLNSPKVIFVMGATDGDFPNQVSVHGLFSENDKQRLAVTGIELSRPLADLIASERLIVYKSMSTASERLYLSYPLTDLSGQAKYPSQVIEQTVGMFDGQKIIVTESEIQPHYYAVTMHSAFYHYMQNRNSRLPSVAAIKKVLLDEPEYRRRMAYVLSRSGYTQDFNIDRDIMKKLKSFTPLRISPTNLEEFNLCHFKYFCNKFLRLKACEKIELDARMSGELIHLCFSRILGSRGKNDFVAMPYDRIQGEIKNCAADYRTKELTDEFGRNSRFELMYNKLTERLGEVLLHTQHELMSTSFVPHRCELDMRFEHSVSMRFGGKYSLNFGGVVDRVDVCDIDGRSFIRIIDYKSSRKKIDAKTIATGTNLQMLLYLFASTKKGGLYENFTPAGVLYSPVQIGDVKLDAHRIESRNSAVIDSGLKTSGLVLEDLNVLEAMENGIAGRYIPVKLTAAGEIDRRSSGCITAEGMEKLREVVYRNLTEMGEALLEGNAEAVPLTDGRKNPCEYCGYVNICDNSLLKRYRLPDEEKIAEAEEILGKSKGKEE